MPAEFGNQETYTNGGKYFFYIPHTINSFLPFQNWKQGYTCRLWLKIKGLTHTLSWSLSSAFCNIMYWCHGNVFDIRGPMRGESTSDWWFHSQRSSNVKLCYVLCSWPKQVVEQTVKLLIWDAMTLMVCYFSDIWMIPSAVLMIFVQNLIFTSLPSKIISSSCQSYSQHSPHPTVFRLGSI